MREELQRANKSQPIQASQHQPLTEEPEQSFIKPPSSSFKKKPSPSFLREIEGIEKDISKLRSQVKLGANFHESEDSSIISDEDIVYVSRSKFVPTMDYQHQQQHDNFSGDLGRTMEILQQRVQALERNLAPFTIPYQSPCSPSAGPSLPQQTTYIHTTPYANGK